MKKIRKIIREAFKDSDSVDNKYVVMYRAVAKNVTEFYNKDYVTLSKKFAVEHAENNEAYHEEKQQVIQALINTRELYEASNPGEYFYSGPDKKGKIIYITKGYDYEGWGELQPSDFIRESEVIDEDAKRMSHLPEGTGLFIDEIHAGYDFYLYNPKTKDVYATMTIVLREPNVDYYVAGVAAEQGFGPFIYELTMMHLNKKGKGLMPSRDGGVKDIAMNVWKKFFERSDVEKKTFELKDPLFSFAILDGEDGYKWEYNEKVERWNSMDKEFYDVNKEDVQREVMVFNTTYSMKPTKEYYKLIDIANKWIEKGFNKQNAADAGEALWDEKYN